jgi:hypothetical protein
MGNKNSTINDGMSSRFPTQSSKGQDTYKSNEDRDKKYAVSFSDKINDNHGNKDINYNSTQEGIDNNTLSLRSENEYNTLSKRSLNGV